jgi:RsiW-degrading membrane proteinase PrsW (M82 family)
LPTLIALCGAVPALFLMWLVDRADAKRPEPRWQLRKLALFGGLATLPVIAVEVFLEGFKPEGVQGALFDAFVVAAFTEETAKALALYFGIWNHQAFDERLDGIVYATRAGLGFALVENIGYLLSQKTAGGALGIWVLRAVLAVPGHAVFAGFMGYWAARRKFDRVGPGLLGGLVIAIALHGSYDGALMVLQVLAQQKDGAALLALPLLLVPLVVVVGGYLRLRQHAREALRLDDLASAPEERPRLPFGLGFVLR